MSGCCFACSPCAAPSRCEQRDGGRGVAPAPRRSATHKFCAAGRLSAQGCASERRFGPRTRWMAPTRSAPLHSCERGSFGPWWPPCRHSRAAPRLDKCERVGRGSASRAAPLGWRGREGRPVLGRWRWWLAVALAAPASRRPHVAVVEGLRLLLSVSPIGWRGVV